MKENSFQKDFNESQKLYELQRKLEDGKINIKSLNYEDKEKLINLYEQQIDYLKDSIENRKKKLKDYKSKIIEKRKQLK